MYIYTCLYPRNYQSDQETDFQHPVHFHYISLQNIILRLNNLALKYLNKALIELFLVV